MNFLQFLRSPGCLGSLKSPESLEYPVYPVSNGQALEEELKGLAGRNATEQSTARKRRWQLARDVRAVEKRSGRPLRNGELMQVLNEWHRLSQPFLDPQKTRDDYLAAFLAGLRKVQACRQAKATRSTKRVKPFRNCRARNCRSYPGCRNAPERWRRLAALHRELFQRTGGNTYFLTCRDTAKAVPTSAIRPPTTSILRWHDSA